MTIPTPKIPAELPCSVTTGRQRVQMRVEPCRCGCKGSDPWHRQTLTRAVCGIHLLAVPRLDWSVDGVSATYVVASGTIRCPWGAQAVELTARVRPNGETYTVGWRVSEPSDCSQAQLGTVS